MKQNIDNFWKSFSEQDFAQAQSCMEQLADTDKQQVLSELYQKSGFARQPLLISVLERKLREGKTADDFREAWLPTEEMRDPITEDGSVFQQHFPVPVRVFNAASLKNPNTIYSIGITWVENEEQEQQLYDYIAQAEQGEAEDNEKRHEKIDEIADGQLIGLGKVISDDNLGVPFGQKSS